MFRKLINYCLPGVLAGLLLIFNPNTSEAGHGGGGFHAGGGGFHAGGGGFHAAGGFHAGSPGAVHVGGYRGGVYHAGFYAHPYAGYGYRGYYGRGYYGYPYARYGYGHIYGGYYPYGGAYYAYPYYNNPGLYDMYAYTPSSGLPVDSGYFSNAGAVPPDAADPLYPALQTGPPPVSAAAPAPADERARFSVDVPANAQLWVENTLTTATGTVREFQSPPLTPGRQYAYTVHARWTDNGHEVDQSQRVQFGPGDHVNMLFPVPPGPAAQAPAVAGR